MPDEIVASVPVVAPPVWAVLQRRLFDQLEIAWREFEARYCDVDGRLDYSGAMFGRDGVDDFYEPFFNWPILAMLGGSAELLASAKRHWGGVTAQLTELGFLTDEFERGYDWFHQGESLVFFYALCAADPADAQFRDRAIRFARLFVADSPTGNYDRAHRMFRAPHVGADGPRPGLGEVWTSYSASQRGMQRYGLPLRDVPGITSWDDLRVPANADAMGEAMQRRLGAGDVAVSLAATSLVANAWLYTGDDELAAWIEEYVGAWAERARENGGLIPDNVGPDGEVGELHGGKWFGGHYGWTWPHGLYSVESAALIAAINDDLVNGNTRSLDLARVPLDTVLALAKTERFNPATSTLGHHWSARVDAVDGPIQLVPYRIDQHGWFDWAPLHTAFPVWLWWYSGSAGDWARLVRVEREAGYAWAETVQFRGKEEAGHEDAWVAWLDGRYPGYPEDALKVALGQVATRRALIRSAGDVPGDDVHWWQQLNPVVTEILVQQIGGAPSAIYNGGLPLMRLRWWDARSGALGLPADVASLVTAIGADSVTVQVVNLSPTEERAVLLQAGTYGEDLIHEVSFDAYRGDWPGTPHAPSQLDDRGRHTETLAVEANRLGIRLPPATQIILTLTIARAANTAAHNSFRTN